MTQEFVHKKPDGLACHMVKDSLNMGYSGMQGRGLYSGARGYGAHVEWTNIGTSKWDYNWGVTVKTKYYMENNGPKDKWVGLSVNNIDVIRLDHSNRNSNQPNFKTREEFEQYAKDNNMDCDKYPEEMSVFHKEGDKMWMARPEDAPNLKLPILGWFLTIPSIEGVFYRNDANNDGYHNSVQGSASYNYGNNLVTHFFWDIAPWWMMDVMFPNP